MSDGCGAPGGGVALTDVDAAKEAVIQGRILRGGAAVDRAYVRLLDSSGEFAGEVPTDGEGSFRFFAAPGAWTIRVLATGGGRAERSVDAQIGAVADLEIVLD